MDRVVAIIPARIEHALASKCIDRVIVSTDSARYRDIALQYGAEVPDKETLDKLQYTKTDIFKGKSVADIGCGAGAFLVFLKGVAMNLVAIEPSRLVP